MSEMQPPKVLWEKSTTPEQITAWESFIEVGMEFTPEELVAALRLKDKIGEDAHFVLPLTAHPDRTEALFEAWSDLLKTADESKKGLWFLFDDETEEAIENNPEFNKLLSAREAARTKERQEFIRDDIRRVRYAEYIGRMAIFTEPNDGQEHELVMDITSESDLEDAI